MSNFCHVHDNIIEVSANFNSISLAFKVNEIGSNNFNFLSGVPGTIGGNIIMNAGCYGYEISRYLIDIKVVDEKLNIITIPKKDIEFGYRNSSLMARNIVVISARIRLVYTQVPSILTLQEKRNKTQPVGKRTLGSTFSNPGRFSAWKLIDSVGLRGFKIGNSKISDKHPNFIEALENSRNEEYWGLVQLMKKMVYLKHKIRLDREIIMYT